MLLSPRFGPAFSREWSFFLSFPLRLCAFALRFFIIDLFFSRLFLCSLQLATWRCAFLCLDYCWRKATMESILDARQAGIADAIEATASIDNAAPVKVAEPLTLTP